MRTDNWISIEERLPEIIEYGESETVLCVGFKCYRQDTAQYELMRWTILEKPDMKDSRGRWIERGWSNRWWDTNPDYYGVTHWQPLIEPKLS